jgi:aminotransferase in exopolysaccharide biosynthesis
MIPLSEPTLGGRELEYVTRCLTTGWISTNGEFVRQLETALATYHGVKHVVACNTGTSALHISLMLSGVQPDDEVIVPTVTFIAPVNAVRYVGAWPVFVDCDEYCNMDVEGVRSFLVEECVVRAGVLTNRTTGRRVAAIVPVHVFGTSADMDSILALAAEFGLAVVEDASESLGSRYKGRMCGTLAPISCLSFNGNKIVTTGAGGAIMTDDDEVARQARYLTTQAKEDGVEYVHDSVGYNYRMNNVLAAIGLAQLETLDERVAIKRDNYARYRDALGPSHLLDQPAWSESNRWFYALLCDSADQKRELMAACAAADVQVRPLWYLNHLQKPYREMQAHHISRAQRFYDTVLNLPCSISLTQEQIASVVGLVQAARRGSPEEPIAPHRA